MSIRLKSSEKNVSSKCGTELKKLKKVSRNFEKEVKYKTNF